MAIHCEFINIIIQIATIDRVYPGGFVAYKAAHAKEFTGRMYHDEYLFRDGAMSAGNAEAIVAQWQERGLVPTSMIDGVEHWHELCSVNMMTGLTRPCTWARYDRRQNCVHMVGVPETAVVGE